MTAKDCSICSLIGVDEPATHLVAFAHPCKKCNELFGAPGDVPTFTCQFHLDLALSGTQHCPHNVYLVFSEPIEIGDSP